MCVCESTYAIPLKLEWKVIVSPFQAVNQLGAKHTNIWMYSHSSHWSFYQSLVCTVLQVRQCCTGHLTQHPDLYFSRAVTLSFMSSLAAVLWHCFMVFSFKYYVWSMTVLLLYYPPSPFSSSLTVSKIFHNSIIVKLIFIVSIHLILWIFAIQWISCVNFYCLSCACFLFLDFF